MASSTCATGVLESGIRLSRKRLGRLSPHELRHTAASLAVAAGGNVKVVQRMLGHASAALTLDTYSGLFDDDLDAVADRVDEAAARVVLGSIVDRQVT